MARVALKSISFFAFIFISAVLLVHSGTVESIPPRKAWAEKATSERQHGTVKPKGNVGGEVLQPELLCEKASLTFSGTCKNTQSCDKQCITWESAVHGACHVRGGKHMCFCYFNC